jgi:hypothetical protein
VLSMSDSPVQSSGVQWSIADSPGELESSIKYPGLC